MPMWFFPAHPLIVHEREGIADAYRVKTLIRC
jgi:hypothetical protein